MPLTVLGMLQKPRRPKLSNKEEAAVEAKVPDVSALVDSQAAEASPL